jgi:hypothetical protein
LHDGQAKVALLPPVVVPLGDGDRRQAIEALARLLVPYTDRIIAERPESRNSRRTV